MLWTEKIVVPVEIIEMIGDAVLDKDTDKLIRAKAYYVKMYNDTDADVYLAVARRIDAGLQSMYVDPVYIRSKYRTELSKLYDARRSKENGYSRSRRRPAMAGAS